MNRQLLLPVLGIPFLIHAPFAAANLVTNGDFSANAAGYTSFPGYDGSPNPAAPTGWTNNNNQQGVNGADTVTTVFGPSSLQTVRDFLFLQNTGTSTVPGVTSSATQNITFAANTSYVLTFSAGARNGFGNNLFGVTVNDGNSNVTSSTTYGAASNRFNTYVVNFTTGASAGAGSLTFANTMTPNADHTVDFSNVVLNASKVPSILNGGFETPNINGGYSEGVTADNWTYIAGSQSKFGGGFVGNGSAYGNAASPEGVQAGLLKADGGMSQNIDGFVVGQTYVLGFYAESRSGYGADPLQITVGTTPITFGGQTTLSPTTGSYSYYTSDPFTVTSTSDLLSLIGTNSNDSAVFIDDIQLPEPASLGLLALSAVGLLARRRRA